MPLGSVCARVVKHKANGISVEILTLKIVVSLHDLSAIGLALLGFLARQRGSTVHVSARPTPQASLFLLHSLMVTYLLETTVSKMSEDHVEEVAGGDDDEVVESPDIVVVPIVKLQKVEIVTGEDEEESIFET